MNGKVSSFKNEIQAQGSEINRLKQQVKVAMEISAEEKQASDDAIKVLEEKLNMLIVCLSSESRNCQVGLWTSSITTLGIVDKAIDVERKKLVDEEKEHNRKLQSLVEEHEKQKDDAAKKFQENMANI